MKTIVRIKNNLEEILKERGVQKSDFASSIETTNSTISNFITQERSTYNVLLIEKILEKLDIDIKDLFSKMKVYEFDNYKPFKYHKYPEKKGYFFVYSNVPNRLLFQLLILKDNIVLAFESSELHNFFIVNNELIVEDREFLKTLIEYIEKEGKSSVSVYGSKQEAFESVQLIK